MSKQIKVRDNANKLANLIRRAEEKRLDANRAALESEVAQRELKEQIYRMEHTFEGAPKTIKVSGLDYAIIQYWETAKEEFYTRNAS